MNLEITFLKNVKKKILRISKKKKEKIKEMIKNEYKTRIGIHMKRRTLLFTIHYTELMIP